MIKKYWNENKDAIMGAVIMGLSINLAIALVALNAHDTIIKDNHLEEYFYYN